MSTTRLLSLIGVLCLTLAGCPGDDSPPPSGSDSSVDTSGDAAPTCTYKGKIYADGEEFTDACNACKCNPTGNTPGSAGCTMKLCSDAGDAGDTTAPTCTYKGKVYADGEEFMDACNACKCNPTGDTPGSAGCSLKGCNDASAD